MVLEIHEVEAKTIISSTKVPSADFVINPYTGCQFACSYCFASFMGRFVGESISNWGNYVYVKTNAVDLFEKEVHRLLKKKPHPRLSISTVTDPYQGVERKYRLTRGVLEALVRHKYRGRVSILTKSPSVMDDVSLLQELENAEVGLSIATTDDALSRKLDMMAPLASARLDVLRRLNEAGIKTYVFVGPLLPHMHLRPHLIDHLFSEIKSAGTSEIKVEFLNMPGHVCVRLNGYLKDEPTEIQEVYSKSQDAGYRTLLEDQVRTLLDAHGLKLRFDEIVHHAKAKSLVEV
ncbi:SPL family radical SAM protein [Ruegeria arenilitoris]|uniref:SPL family radical SAM protein n=1 Tax=Ruegeria arenilitoris TaxID=1173585 RepID=UPI001481799F|nr:radical SAM protein [Ruegeria arenilitoris]